MGQRHGLPRLRLELEEEGGRGAAFWRSECTEAQRLRQRRLPMNKIALALASAFCAGCIGTADSISVIRGQLVRSDGTEVSGCTALVYSSGSREPLSKVEKAVEPRFFVSLVNAPKGGTAVLEFKCPGHPGVMRSREIELSGASDPAGIDIGRVVVK